MIEPVKRNVIVEPVKTVNIEIEPGEVTAVLELVLTDGDKVIEYRRLKSKSFVRQFLELFYVIANALSSAYPWTYVPFTIRDTSNNLRNVAQNATIFSTAAGAGASAYGIVVGTGSAAPTINDYKLGTQIAHGTNPTQIQYGAMAYGLPVSDGTLSTFRLTRPFSNASGGSITVNEIGIYVTDGTYYYMTVRDVIVPIGVPNRQVLTVNYQMVVSV
jgi:hypothetical protein